MNAAIAAGLGVGGLGLVALITVVFVIRSFANRTISALSDKFKARERTIVAEDYAEDMVETVTELQGALTRERRANEFLQQELEAAFRRGPVLDPGTALRRSLRKIGEALDHAAGGEGTGGVHGNAAGGDNQA